MSLRSRVAVLCVTVGVALCGAPAAHAACTSSTPASATFTDPANDTEGPAPDLRTLTFSLDAACTFTFDPALAEATVDDGVVTFVDRDGNPATGDPDLPGTDLLTVTVTDGAESLTLLAWWSNGDYALDEGPLIEDAPSPGGYRVAVDRLGLVPGTSPGFRVVSMRIADEFGIDLAPDSGDTITLPINYAGEAAVPTPAPQAPPSTPQPSPSPLPLPVTPPTIAKPRCTVPKVKGRTVARARSRLTASGCTPAANVTRRYSTTVRKGRVIGTSPGTGKRTNKKVRLIVSKGKRPKRAKARAAADAHVRAAARRALLARAQAIVRAL